MKRRVAALAIAAITMSIVVLGWLAPSAATAATTPAPYPVSTCGLFSVSSTTAHPGDTVTVSGTGFGANVKVKIVFSPPKQTLLTLTTSAAGTFSASVKIPSVPSGTYSLAAVVAGLTCPTDPVRIVIGGGASGSSGGHTPAKTGVDVELLGILAGLLLLVGLGFAGAGHRRGRSRGRHAV